MHGGFGGLAKLFGFRPDRLGSGARGAGSGASGTLSGSRGAGSGASGALLGSHSAGSCSLSASVGYKLDLCRSTVSLTCGGKPSMILRVSGCFGIIATMTASLSQYMCC